MAAPEPDAPREPEALVDAETDQGVGHETDRDRDPGTDAGMGRETNPDVDPDTNPHTDTDPNPDPDRDPHPDTDPDKDTDPEADAPPGPEPVTVPSMSAGPDFVLRPWEMSDLPLVREASQDPYIPLITTIPAHYSDAAAEAFVRRQWERAATGPGTRSRSSARGTGGRWAPSGSGCGSCRRAGPRSATGWSPPGVARG